MKTAARPATRPRPRDGSAATGADRAARVRAALRELVAANGLHGTAMSAVAATAGVATGTAYLYYSSKDELVLAAYRETKLELASAAVGEVDSGAAPELRFEQLWFGVYRYLIEAPELARFLVQIESSPYSRIHHEGLEAQEPPDPLVDAARQPDMAARLLHLPLEVLFDLGLAPAIRLAAAGADMSETDLTTVAHACWRAISLP